MLDSRLESSTGEKGWDGISAILKSQPLVPILRLSPLCISGWLAARASEQCHNSAQNESTDGTY